MINEESSLRLKYELSQSSQVLSASEVGDVFLGLLDVTPAVQEAPSSLRQVSVGLVSVQMAVTNREELEHPVSQCATLHF